MEDAFKALRSDESAERCQAMLRLALAPERGVEALIRVAKGSTRRLGQRYTLDDQLSAITSLAVSQHARAKAYLSNLQAEVIHTEWSSTVWQTYDFGSTTTSERVEFPNARRELGEALEYFVRTDDGLGSTGEMTRSESARHPRHYEAHSILIEALRSFGIEPGAMLRRIKREASELASDAPNPELQPDGTAGAVPRG